MNREELKILRDQININLELVDFIEQVFSHEMPDSEKSTYSVFNEFLKDLHGINENDFLKRYKHYLDKY